MFQKKGETLGADDIPQRVNIHQKRRKKKTKNIMFQNITIIKIYVNLLWNKLY